MCYEVKCSICARRSWSGCGRHVQSVYRKIPQGQHCTCKEWPGIDFGSSAAAATSIAGGRNHENASLSSDAPSSCCVT